MWNKKEMANQNMEESGKRNYHNVKVEKEERINIRRKMEKE